jgi:hypothetical protein
LRNFWRGCSSSESEVSSSSSLSSGDMQIISVLSFVNFQPGGQLVQHVCPVSKFLYIMKNILF